MLGIQSLVFCAIDFVPEDSVSDEIVYIFTIDSCSTGFPYVVEYVKVMGYAEKCIPGNKKGPVCLRNISNDVTTFRAYITAQFNSLVFIGIVKIFVLYKIYMVLVDEICYSGFRDIIV